MTPKKIYLSKLVMAGVEILDKPVSDSDVEYIRADVIRTEIERLKSLLVRGACAAQIEMETNCKEEAYDEVLSFLSTLESEKPMNQEDIDTEIGHWMDRLDDKYCLLVPHYSIQDIKDTARYFAKWGAEHLKK